MKQMATAIHGVVLLEPTVHKDERGYFVETYQEKTFPSASRFIQDNQSLSHQAGTIRGLHGQKFPYEQMKVVRCVRGAIYDVAVDLRIDSETYQQWVGVILTEHNQRQLIIPKGFLHGFCTLVPETIVSYKIDTAYHPESEYGIRWDDPTLAIDWPCGRPILSEKDQNHPYLSDRCKECD